MAKKISKRHRENLKLLDVLKKYSVDDAFELISKFQSVKFDETVNVSVRLGVDTKQSDQQVRGAAVLPNGTGKKVKILVFAKGAKAQEAKDAGADYIGDEEVIAKINSGWTDFDKVIATPDMMVAVSKVGKVLGPRGLMPNPKTGTVTNDVSRAIQEERKGKIEFRAEKSGIVHAPIGKKSFGNQKLKENFLSLLETIARLKPATSKGVYVRSVTVSGAMSPGVSLDTGSLGLS